MHKKVFIGCLEKFFDISGNFEIISISDLFSPETVVGELSFVQFVEHLTVPNYVRTT